MSALAAVARLLEPVAGRLRVPDPSRLAAATLPAERRWIETVLETLLPCGVVEGLPGARETALADYMDEYLRRVPPLTALGLRAAFAAVAWSPVATLGRAAPITRLDAADREAHLVAWESSDNYWVRETVTLLKAATLLGWGGDRRVRESLGIGP